MSRKKRQKERALKQPKKQKQERGPRVDERLKEIMKFTPDVDVNLVRENENKVERWWRTRPRWKDPEVHSR
ncbi:MAG: hypothetical protein AABX52_04050 [Nanoarchaeota archaeon]